MRFTGLSPRVFSERRALPRLHASYWFSALTFLMAVLTSACGHKQVALGPPQPPSLPPGVTWGRPAGGKVISNPARPPEIAGPENTARAGGRLLRAGIVWRIGVASFYGRREQGNFTASGERFNMHRLTAASRTLPFGTIVRVTDLVTGRSVNVRINDRGPFWPHRIIDLSVGAAKRIGLYRQGLARVRLRILRLPDPLPPGFYTVQVGWFTQAGKLKRCRRDMRRYFNAPVISFRSREGRWLRYRREVRLSRQTAAEVVAALRRHRFPAYLVRLN